ncbi:hypothetical protein A3J78_01210 [Candidatus Beckwithbacteria bacterium RBG_13_35_6]|uniref:Four helix bundle protein n=1 Tax=Candidatus Beckwithbacteria bacterium RBG_13_35_6 TaxID=1797456 RepID=A0A1F5DC27_9BACT|nr:MAG: hypothetical protein A3J78_01210 [Candidatus Beckwithbacteria bacterium RBG_13_35_6]
MGSEKFNIHERIYWFVLRVLKLILKLNKNQVNLIIINQLTRSVTSVGANDQEADGVSSKADFIHCYTVARKELKESIFWLRILGDLNPAIKFSTEKEILEGKELVKIISKIIINTRSKN